MLACVFSMLGVTFSVLDWVRFGELHAVAASTVVAAGGCAMIALVMSRSALTAVKPLVAGLALAGVYLGTCWLFA